MIGSEWENEILKSIKERRKKKHFEKVVIKSMNVLHKVVDILLIYHLYQHNT